MAMVCPVESGMLCKALYSCHEGVFKLLEFPRFSPTHLVEGHIAAHIFSGCLVWVRSGNINNLFEQSQLSGIFMVFHHSLMGIFGSIEPFLVTSMADSGEDRSHKYQQYSPIIDKSKYTIRRRICSNSPFLIVILQLCQAVHSRVNLPH